MPFYFHHADKRVALDDLPLEHWITIQEATGRQWPDILTRDVVGDVKVAQAVIGEACKYLGIEPPKLTLKSMLEAITFEAAENIPEQFNDGVPDPKASASEPVTT